MKYQSTLHEGIFLKRYKRFFADIRWKNEIITAHVPNTGSLKTVNTPESPCLFSTVDDPDRKLKYTLQAIQTTNVSGERFWVGVNTNTPNQLVKESAPLIWPQFPVVQPEYKINSESRLDFALSRKESLFQHFVEVKNVTMSEVIHEKNVAMFPDAITTRGQKHLKDLVQLIEQGHTAEIVFTIQRGDCSLFKPADHIDPEYGKLLRWAESKGLKISPYIVWVNEHQAVLSDKIPYSLL